MTEDEDLEPLIQRMQWAVFTAEVHETIRQLPGTRKTPPSPEGERGAGGPGPSGIGR